MSSILKFKIKKIKMSCRDVLLWAFCPAEKSGVLPNVLPMSCSLFGPHWRLWHTVENESLNDNETSIQEELANPNENEAEIRGVWFDDTIDDILNDTIDNTIDDILNETSYVRIHLYSDEWRFCVAVGLVWVLGGVLV